VVLTSRWTWRTAARFYVRGEAFCPYRLAGSALSGPLRGDNEDERRAISQPNPLPPLLMSSTTTLGHFHFAFVNAEATGLIYAHGEVLPRLCIELKLRTPRERVKAEIHFLRLQVQYAGEVLAEGTSSGDFVDFYDRRVIVESPIGRRALEFVNERLVADRVDLTLLLSGWMRIHYDPEDGESLPVDLPADGWTFTTFGMNSTASIMLQVPRGEWFKQVIEPVGTIEYVLTEIPLLKGGVGVALEKSYKQLQEAERHWATGNDPSVFFHCKGAIEALPGWPQRIFDPLVDQTKAKYLDRLVHSAKNYFDHGRHIAQSGLQEGEFPVDHQEAQFALALTKVLLAEVGGALGARSWG